MYFVLFRDFKEKREPEVQPLVSQSTNSKWIWLLDYFAKKILARHPPGYLTVCSCGHKVTCLHAMFCNEVPIMQLFILPARSLWNCATSPSYPTDMRCFLELEYQDQHVIFTCACHTSIHIRCTYDTTALSPRLNLSNYMDTWNCCSCQFSFAILNDTADN